MSFLRYLVVDVQSLWFGGPFIYAGMNPIALYLGHELCEGYFPLAWRPFTDTHLELVVMDLWATALWLAFAYGMYRKGVFFSL